MNRLLIYVHFNKYNSLSNHVIYQLTKMRHIFKRVLFISNSYLSEADKSLLEKNQLITELILRENRGFDFAAWKEGIDKFGYKNLENYDSITLMNDTCFGPLYDLLPYYEKYEDSLTDFWGITDHREFQDIETHDKFEQHVQSYFMVFSKKVVISEPFSKFWKEVKVFETVVEVITKYESHLTAILRDAGFSYKAIIETISRDASKMPYPNFSLFAPEVLIQEKCPFIKVKIFDFNLGIAPYIIDNIEKKSDYPVSLIKEHLYQTDFPHKPFLIEDSYLTTAERNIYDKKVAIHIHVYFPDLLTRFLELLIEVTCGFDLFLTTDSKEKQSIIQEILKNFKFNVFIKVFPNRGRDIIPLLELRRELSNYEIIGHFHTKRSDEVSYFVGDSWREELMAMLVKPADNIISQMNLNNNLGVVIADIPSYFRYNYTINFARESEALSPIMNKLWDKLKRRKTIDFSSLDDFIMSYGTFFWARREVLEPLFNLDLKDIDIPEEPLGQNTVLHVIERILVYLAWDMNYDFKISPNEKKLPPFIDRQKNNKYVIELTNYADTMAEMVKAQQSELERIRNSKSFKVGSLITKPFRELKKMEKSENL
ncbi:rhamnan synthesis F family protein [Lactovum miscens]|uniref:Rhamnosyltransferase n=1 Tax=Lactovum miscens TaxID=190387 RepID=A0A841C4D1_9LACT|nr:rhamnan synthesis F family protein [Lactovum miscens]MBB5887673.1 rhamnosyltransferase [Lactovum miscens]